MRSGDSALVGQRKLASAVLMAPSYPNRKRRVMAKVEWRPGELYPRAGFIVTNLGQRGQNHIQHSLFDPLHRSGEVG